MSGMRRPRLTFENTLWGKLEGGEVKNIWGLGVWMKRLKMMDEGKEVCRNCTVWCSVLSGYSLKESSREGS